MNNAERKKKKAASLAEVMIVLGILSTVLVASVSVLVNSMLRISINDLEDAANTIMIQALEISKSPVDVLVSDLSIQEAGFETTQNFSLDITDEGNVLQRQSEGALTECTPNSVYNINSQVRDIQTKSNICLQVRITPLEGLDGIRVYRLESEVVFRTPKETRSNSIIGFRYRQFTTLPNQEE